MEVSANNSYANIAQKSGSSGDFESGCDDSSCESLCASTCKEFHMNTLPLLCGFGNAIYLSVNLSGFGMLDGEFREPEGIRFKITFQPSAKLAVVASKRCDEELLVKIFGESTNEKLEWRYLIQMRWLTTIDGKKEIVKGDIFYIGSHCDPIVLSVQNRCITGVEIQARIIEKDETILPSFNDGDLLLTFYDGSLLVYRSLLALNSDYMARTLHTFDKTDFIQELQILDTSVDDFKELLYQIYPVKREIFHNLNRLARCAIGFGVTRIVDKICNYLVDNEEWDFEEKLQRAIDLQLQPAIEKITLKPEFGQFWRKKINAGFDPELKYGPRIYRDVILPTIAWAKLNCGNTMVKSPQIASKEFKFRGKSGRKNPFNVALVVQGVVFYVNRGIIAVHNDGLFGRGDKGEYLVQIDINLSRECDRADTTPVNVVEALLQHIYPSRQPLPPKFIRPMLALTHYHQMHHAIRSLEDYLVEEPPDSPRKLLEHFELAEHYQLTNLMFKNLYRVENSCHHFVMALCQLDEYANLRAETKNSIMHHYCSGWNYGRIIPQKRSNGVRNIVLADVSPDTDGGNLDTLEHINSSEVFGLRMSDSEIEAGDSANPLDSW